MENEKASNRSREKALEKEKETILNDLYTLFSNAYGESFLKSACGVPDGEDTDKDGLPYTDPRPGLKWGAKYTCYDHRQRLHSPSCRYAGGGAPVNAYEVKEHQGGYVACRICYPTLPNMEWVKNYNKLKKLFPEPIDDTPSASENKQPVVPGERINCGTFRKTKNQDD